MKIYTRRIVQPEVIIESICTQRVDAECGVLKI